MTFESALGLKMPASYKSYLDTNLKAENCISLHSNAGGNDIIGDMSGKVASYNLLYCGEKKAVEFSLQQPFLIFSLVHPT